MSTNDDSGRRSQRCPRRHSNNNNNNSPSSAETAAGSGSSENSGNNNNNNQRLKRPMTRSATRSGSRRQSPSLADDDADTAAGGNSRCCSPPSSSAPKQRRSAGDATGADSSSPVSSSVSPPTASAAAATGSGTSGSSASQQLVSSELTCVLCRDIFREPYSLSCGHSYCHDCIFEALLYSARCPTCEKEVKNPDLELHPNFSLASVVDRYAPATPLLPGGTITINTSRQASFAHFLAQQHRQQQQQQQRIEIRPEPPRHPVQSSTTTTSSSSRSVASRLQEPTMLHNVPEPQQTGAGTNLGNVAAAVAIVNSSSNNNSCGNSSSSNNNNNNTLAVASTGQLDDELDVVVSMDMAAPSSSQFSEPDERRLSAGVVLTAAEIDREIQRLRVLKARLELRDDYLENVLLGEFLGNVKASMELQLSKLQTKLEKVAHDLGQVSTVLGRADSDSTATSQETQPFVSSAGTREAIRSLGSHFSDFEELYDRSVDDEARRLASFRKALVQGTRYNALRPIASIDFAMGALQRTSCIVSSVAFNSRRDLFALAGVTKEIKVYDYASAVGSATSSCPLVYPVTRMQNEKNKVSCIAWSPFHANQLGSTDYDGYVVVWDALRSAVTTQWNEHDKRCWTIDFNKAEPDMLATGSDDFKVKIWKLNCEHSVNQIEWARSNVCAVDFHPLSRYHIVFGASDHNLYYFDLRQVRSPVAVMRGHTKAVSYTRFLSPTEICSASIDGTLRLWDVNSKSCVRSYSGHTNEMNFVGLDTYSNYIVCGSETNEVFVYYKHLRRPLFTYKFPSEPSLPEPPNSFVSALAWNKSAGALLAANSQGYAKLLEFEAPAT